LLSKGGEGADHKAQPGTEEGRAISIQPMTRGKKKAMVETGEKISERGKSVGGSEASREKNDYSARSRKRRKKLKKLRGLWGEKKGRYRKTLICRLNYNVL